ncbi:hypothetical protein GOBAR_AA23309 [Gossypium barbadense]|uniref:Uncharacterized protein n=1 Tax=Gossypium barbadense TaxID=3634 RepID=A0A2P5X204_GOSBA|nr:hypothetical protein GOBAR_AA23309 [Gossypium barbadense]
MKDIWNLQPGTRIVVDANQYGQPIGKEASKLAEFLGTIARTGSICPLNTKHWKHLPKYVLENILAIVHMVQEGRPIQEIYENNPPSVHDDQWKWLVERWGTPQAAAQSEKMKESRTKVRYAHTAGRTGYATVNAQFAKNEGREPSHLEQFRFQRLRKDGSDKLSSEAAQQVYKTRSIHKCLALKIMGYGRGMTKSRLFGYGSVTRGSQSTSSISTMIEEMSAKHVQQIQIIQVEQAVREKTLLEEAESQFRMEAAEREAHLIAEAEERFMKLTEIREAKFMEMLDAHDKKYKALIDECMAKGMSSKYKVFHNKHSN